MSDQTPTATSTLLTKEAILKADDAKIQRVDVPEWGGHVFIRSISANARDKFEGSRYKFQNDKVVPVYDYTRAKLLAMTICDEKGALIFSDADIVTLGTKNGAVMDRLFDIAQELSGMRPKDVEEKLKNFAAAHLGDSSSSSQDTSAKP